MRLVDTHIHLTDKRYQEEEIVAITNNVKIHNIDKIITLGTDLADSKEAKKIADRNEKVYFGVGCHPHEASKHRKQDLEIYEELAINNQKCMAIGEIGLDYHYTYSENKVQVKTFCDLLELAKSLNLPVSIHSREAENEVYEIIRDFKDLRMVCHSYTGSVDIAEKMLDLGVYFSINGVVTFKKNENIIEILKRIPTNKLLLETDGPYLAPIPYRGKMNKPQYLINIAQKIAEILDKTVEDIAKITTENAEELFFK